MSELRSDPQYIDINLTTSLDFQKQMTDYVDLLLAFPDETVVNHIYWHTNSHSDPITSKIELFKQLNSKDVKIKDNTEGAIKAKTTEDKLYNKNIRDQLNDTNYLATSDGVYGPPEVNGNLAKTKIYKYTKQWVSVDGDEKNAFSNGRWEKKNLEPEEVDVEVTDRTQVQEDATTLESKFGMEDMNPVFILWWMEKFLTSHHIIQRDIKEILGDDNEYFVNFSESVGQLKNINDTINTDTTPIIDTDVEAYEDKSIPTIIPGIVEYCAKPETYSLAAELSKTTNKVFRSNIVSHLDDASRDTVVNMLAELPTNPHGCNLVHDVEHPKRVMRFVDTIREEIENHLKGLYDVLELLSNRENYMTTGKPRQILCKVENFTMSMDLFKNKIKVNNLTECDKTLGRYGKGTFYNDQYKNTDYLAPRGVDEVQPDDS
jgi:hypothetical protein